MLGRGLNILLGVQAGHEGKGKVAVWLADTEEVDVSVCDFTPDVSYSATLNGEDYATSQVPMAAAVRALKGAPLPSLAVILPTAIIQPELLMSEVVRYGLQDRLMIDSRCLVMEEKFLHQPTELDTIVRYFAGDCMAWEDVASVPRAGNVPILQRWVVNDATKIVRDLAAEGKRVLYEMGHSFDRSVSFGSTKPMLRDNTVGAALNAAGCPPQLLAEVIAVVKAKEFDGRLGRTLARCWRINKPTQAVVNFLDEVTDAQAFIKEAQLNIATDTLWLSGSPDADSIQRW